MLGDFSTELSVSRSDDEGRPDFLGRSVGPTFRADLRKSLLVHLKLPVDEDTVFAGDSLFGACGGSARLDELESDGDFCLTITCFGGVFDFDSVDFDFSDLLDLLDPLRDRTIIFGGDVSFDFDETDFDSDSVSLLAELYFDELLLLVLVAVPLLRRVVGVEYFAVSMNVDHGCIRDDPNLEYFVESSKRSD